MPVAKAYAKASAQIEEDKAYSVEEAVDLAKRVAHAKFDETVELAVRLGRQSEARGSDGPGHGASFRTGPASPCA